MTRRIASLRLRLLLVLLGGVLLVWLAAAWLSYRQARHELDELLDAHLAQAAALLVAQTASELDDIELDHLPEFGGAHRRIALQVWNEVELGVHSTNAPNQPLSAFRAGFADSTLPDGPWRVYAAPTHEGAWVLVGEPHSARRHILDSALTRQIGPLLIALPVLGFGIWLALGRGLAPLRRLAAQIAARDPLDTTPLAASDAPSEVRPLIERLDALFVRVGESVLRERRFVGDASHELRTPIAAIRAQAQVAEGARDADERRRALANVIAGCDRATHLAEQLLTLSRLDAQFPAPSRPTEVQPLAGSAMAELAREAEARGMRIGLAIPHGLAVACEPALLAIVLRNLLDNAIRHGRDGGRIEIRADARNEPRGEVVVEVRDDGPGIPADQRDRAVQRFHRLAGQDRHGAGLGLAIVQRIAEVTGAQLDLGPGLDGRGLGVTLRWPAP